MYLEVSCPGCGHPLAFATQNAGKQARCSRCGSDFTVPAPGEPPANVTVSQLAQSMQSKGPLAAPMAAAVDLSDRGIRIVCALYLLMGVLHGIVAVLLTVTWLSLSEKSPSYVTIPSIHDYSILQSASREPFRVRGSLVGALIACHAFEALSYLLISRWLRLRIRYSLCFLIAIVACLTIPLGTALGLVTIIMLQDAEIRRSFLGFGKSNAF